MTTAIDPQGRRTTLRVDAQGRLLVKVAGSGGGQPPGQSGTLLDPASARATKQILDCCGLGDSWPVVGYAVSHRLPDRVWNGLTGLILRGIRVHPQSDAFGAFTEVRYPGISLNNALRFLTGMTKDRLVGAGPDSTAVVNDTSARDFLVRLFAIPGFHASCQADTRLQQYVK